MTSFIYTIAQRLHQIHGADYKDVIILSPNRRATLFLQREISQLQNGPIWSPRLMTMDQLVKEYSTFAEADRLTVIYRIFQCWQDILSKKERFEQFFAWGDRIFRDFDLIEKYRVNAEQLFSNLSEEKIIEEQFSDWREDLKDDLRKFHYSLLGESKEEHKVIHDFLEFWVRLGDLKKKLDATLESQGMTYSGRMYRALAEQVDQLKKWEDKAIYFVGFNRLNACESAIMNYAVEQLNAQAFWNTDHAIEQEGKWNNAGWFQRKIDHHPRHHKIDAGQLGKQKEVHICAVQKNAAQAKWLAELVARQNAAPAHTVIILPNEHLLLPLLSSIPESVQKVNVSMGVSLKETPAFTLIEAYLTMHENANDEAGVIAYYLKDIQVLVQHPYVPFDIDPRATNSLYLQPEEICDMIEEEWHAFFQPLQGAAIEDTFRYFKHCLESLHSWHIEHPIHSGGLAEYIAEVLVFAHQKWTRLGELFVCENMSLHFESLMHLIRQYFRNARIPFKGEPLEGLQILGPLESRNLDFEQVYIPNLNEGVFPGTPKLSVVPFHLRKAFGLPTHDEETAEEAYYFYMALARADRADLLYNSMTDDTGSKEVSRFIQYIRMRAEDWVIKETKLSQKVTALNAESISIPKTKLVMQQLRDVFQEGLSPSSISDYMDCSLRFYFKKVAKLRTDTDVENLYHPLNIGKALHKVMELLYEPYNGKVVTAEVIKELKEKVNAIIGKAIQSELKLDQPYQKRGEAFMVLQTVKSSVEKILSYDLLQVPFVMHAHEFDLSDLNSTIDVAGFTVKINGYIDRWDEKEGVMRLFDYKTGSEGYKDKRAELIYDFERVFSAEDKDKRHKLAMQLALYALALRNTAEYKNMQFQPAHFVTREMYPVEKYDHRFRKSDHEMVNALEKEDYELIKRQFQKLIEEMTNQEVPFEQTDNHSKCYFCPYRQICKRDKEKF